MDSSDIINIEIDITTLGIEFENLNPIEYEDSDESTGELSFIFCIYIVIISHIYYFLD